MTFTEWHGHMDWPLDPGWQCEVCGNNALRAWVNGQRIPFTTGLEWGFTHGVCRCTKCHAKYTMRRDGKRITTPFSLLKPKYKTAAKLGWEGLPLDEWTDDMWTEALEWVQEAKKGEGHEQPGVPVSV